jgi:hypothetical protein
MWCHFFSWCGNFCPYYSNRLVIAWYTRFRKITRAHKTSLHPPRLMEVAVPLSEHFQIIERETKSIHPYHTCIHTSSCSWLRTCPLIEWRKWSYYEIAHKTSLHPPRLMEVAVPSQESERLCICVSGISMLSLFLVSGHVYVCQEYRCCLCS